MLILFCTQRDILKKSPFHVDNLCLHLVMWLLYFLNRIYSLHKKCNFIPKCEMHLVILRAKSNYTDFVIVYFVIARAKVNCYYQVTNSVEH